MSLRHRKKQETRFLKSGIPRVFPKHTKSLTIVLWPPTPLMTSSARTVVAGGALLATSGFGGEAAASADSPLLRSSWMGAVWIHSDGLTSGCNVSSISPPKGKLSRIIRGSTWPYQPCWREISCWHICWLFWLAYWNVFGIKWKSYPKKWTFWVRCAQPSFFSQQQLPSQTTKSEGTALS